jgi:O-acetyl-ADP-ribose deacetylase (regulator of RNase III)
VYREAYEREGLALGTVTVAEPEPELIIVNAVTQDHWRHDNPAVVLANYEAIERAFRLVRDIALGRKLPVHFPLIGCGLARGDWNEVAPRIERALGDDVEKHLWRLSETA